MYLKYDYIDSDTEFLSLDRKCKSYIGMVQIGIYLKYDYIDSDTEFLSLDRKCKSYIGMVQIGIVFPPCSGTDKARRIAKDIADFFEDGKMLATGYISEGAITHKLQKSETGWFYPVRFYVRFDGK
ncbi:tail terminator [Citrobacter phage HCF1]|uniref:Minor tail protein n=1 Tax=Citrobacter phage HCF1 TaxID=2849700 RepID=A0ABX6D3N7_9CAUD|nr:tail terminator [Citrobacter phage HCF1]